MRSWIESWVAKGNNPSKRIQWWSVAREAWHKKMKSGSRRYEAICRVRLVAVCSISYSKYIQSGSRRTD